MKNNNSSNIMSNNIVIAYIHGKAIVQTEWGDLYYIEMPKEFVSLGDVLSLNGLDLVENLPKEEATFIFEEIEYEI